MEFDESQFNTERSIPFGDDEEEEEFAQFAVKQEVEDLPTFDADADIASEDESPPMDKELTMDGCKVCDPDVAEVETSTEQKTTWTEQVHMIHLRRYIDQLAEKVKDKDYMVQKTREEFRTCNDRIENLERERDETLRQIQQAKDTDNVPASDRLTEAHTRICEELENENGLLTNIKETLDKTEYELSKAKVEQGKYLLKEDDLIKKENKLRSEKTDMAMFRNKKEQKYADNYLRQEREKQRQYNMALEDRERTIQYAIEQAQYSQAKHSKHLQRTVTKIKQREQEEQVRSKAHMKQRMETMISLKKDITQNRENLRALQARDKALEREKQNKQTERVNSILAEGGNPEEALIKAQKLEEYAKEKELHQIKQRELQTQIAKKILQEEERVRRRKDQQPQLWDDPEREKTKIVKPHKKRKLRVFEEMTKDKTEPQYDYDMTKFAGKTGDESEDEDDNILTSQNTRENTFVADSDSENEDNTVLAKPEFNGMWDSHKPYTVPKGDLETGPKMPGASKMEKEIMSRVLEKTREGVVTKQVAAGREFTGKPFYSKPDIIHFKDFDVGKTYKKKVILTNVSYSVNYCKLIGITEHLKDFIEIHFDPPGQMSAGLTCEMLVTFKPMINEDLTGEVSFLAQTGPFAIPLVCTTKKCDLSVDIETVDFGMSVIGETLKRYVTLTNNGALATKYEFFKMTGMKQRTVTTAETSLGRLTTADTMRNVSPDSENPLGEKKKKTSTDGVGDEKQDDKGGDAGTEADEGTKGDNEGDLDDEDIPEMDGGSSMAIERMDDLVDLDGMTVGHVVAGEVGPFSSIKIEVVWAPTIPGTVDVDFAISFSDPDSDNININAIANAIDVPVWVERQTVDLKICMFDRLFQDTIIVNNRATTALRLKFEVCKELRNHLELLPKTGYIQAQSQFSAQLKFLPRKNLFEEAGKYFDRETGVLEAPMTIRVANQTRPVPFTVHAVVTSSDLEFDVDNIDFGHCTIYEAVKKTVRLSNKSILSQRFGFVGIPEYVDVQPNDGFGTLLPLETIEMDIIFQPRKARDFNFELTCKSLINREFKISCKGVGVHPPLDLSHQIIHFSATALNDVSPAIIHVVNNHTSMNEFSHPVPRIGKGEIAPVGPTSFEFVVPKDAPFTVSPSVGTVEPGKKERIQLRFMPKLRDEEIRREAVRMITRTKEMEAQEEYKRQLMLEQQQKEEAAKAPPGGKKGKDKDPPKNKPQSGKNDPKKTSVKMDKDGGLSMQVRGPNPVQPPDAESITKDSPEYHAAHASLLRQFKGRFGTYTVPCYLASGKCAKPGELEYSVHNTLYLEVHCPAIRPQLVVISDSGNPTLDFEEISIGQSVIKSMTIQNISDKPIDMHSSMLDPEGPFTMLNALRMLPPDASHTMLICFSPHRGAKFLETLEINAPTSTLHLNMKGDGISPMINLSVQDGCYDFGAVIAGEYREESFKISNTSELSIQYCIKMDSQSLLRYSKNQGLPQFVKRDIKSKSLLGTQNNNGQQVFDCVPANGVIPAGGFVDIVVTFAPDHPSDFYADGVRIDLFGQEEQHVFQIKGSAKPHIMFLADGDDFVPEVESLSVLPVEDAEEIDVKGATIPFLVSVRSIARETEFEPGTRTITVGCVRTMAVSQKKNGEWVFDNLTPIQQLGFNIDQPKGMMEAGTIKPIAITWAPPAGYDPNKPMETSINLTLRGDVVEVYRVMLKGFVVSE